MSKANPLKQQRLASGLTQLDLAEKVGFSQQLISKLERDKVTLTPAHATKLAKALNCLPAALYPALALTPQPAGENEQEIQLLVAYRTMSPENREILFATAQMMASQLSKSNQVNAN
ncbi:helix-turn-helix transcriptional regulator [uncultured Ruegeria sp.]|uniref:helix-turn-helix domain-containing protein n=1 Tax=uncultured Ruegeria sp. TaxID=259304 RepID=UPI002605F7B0|nr:helix-turn-helix transcriptional regulator [uncultured Ruegeria sp.]